MRRLCCKHQMKYLSTLILLFMIGFQAKAQLNIGDQAPSFKLLDQDGNTFNSDEVIGKEICVIYFYPKDDTPGCTKEACSFRDNYQDFIDAGVKVIGISADDVESHKMFANKYKLPYTLLCDTDNSVRKLFGVKSDLFGLIPGRVTYVIDQEGVIRHIFSSQMNFEKHISESLRVINEM